MTRLAIISTHPIQYNAPFFRELNLQEDIVVKVFYTWSQATGKIYDPGFGVTREWDIPLLEGYEYEFIKNISLRPGSHHFFGIINPSLISKVKKWKPNSILIYGWSFCSHLQAIKYFHNKIPVLFRGDSTILDQSSRIRSLVKKMLLKWVYSSVDLCLSVGTNNTNYFLKYGVENAKVIYLPHAVENDRFQLDDNYQKVTEFSNIKRELNDKIVFLFVGKYEKKKNPTLLANVFCKVDFNNVALLFVGQGQLERELKEITEGNMNVFYLPFQNQGSMRNIYQLADVLVLPSAYNETWGLVVNEAMAAGLAIIVSDKVGCAVDLVENEVNGYIFKSGDQRSLFNTINEIRIAKLSLMKQASVKKIKDFSIKKNAILLRVIVNNL